MEATNKEETTNVPVLLSVSPRGPLETRLHQKTCEEVATDMVGKLSF